MRKRILSGVTETTMLPFRAAKVVVLWGSVALGTLIFGSGTVIGSVFFLRTKQKRLLHYYGGVKWAKAILAVNPWWRFEVHGRENLPQEGEPVVYVSNHLSQTDILAVYSIGMDFRWLSKDSIFRIPIMGWAMSAIGYVPINRGDRSSHRRAMEMSKAHLKERTSMVFFPEGTRSKDGRLKPFKIGAFALAKAVGVPIVPITLQGPETLLPKGSVVPGDSDVEVTVHPALYWKEGESADEMMKRTFEVMNESLPHSMRFGG